MLALPLLLFLPLWALLLSLACRPPLPRPLLRLQGVQQQRVLQEAPQEAPLVVLRVVPQVAQGEAQGEGRVGVQGVAEAVAEAAATP